MLQPEDSPVTVPDFHLAALGSMQYLQTPEVRILIGIPASGKSTIAKQLEQQGYFRLNYDSMKAPGEMLAGKAVGDMHKQAKRMVRQALSEGRNVVIDNTNLNMRTIASWVSVAREFGATSVTQLVDTSIEECVKRDRVRPERVGRACIERMALDAGFLKFPEDKKIAIFDVDGTLADISHRKHFVEGQKKKDWPGFYANVMDDAPVETVVTLAKAFFDDPDYKVVVVSGRPRSMCGLETEAWLDKHGIPYHHLLMRDRSDYRPDFEIKQEILDLLPKHQIAIVFDDRDQVVAMWRRNRIRCIQVAEGNF